MKKGFYILVLTGCIVQLIVVFACSKNYKTYEELKTDEKKIISRILDSKNIEVLYTYPTDGKFGENQFVELNTGIYLNVVDSGNGNRAIPNVTTVLVRASGEVYDRDSTYTFNTFANSSNNMSFRFGNAYSVVSQYSLNIYSDYYRLFGMGLEHILNYVGDSAVVRLIIPGYSEISGYPGGSTFQTANNNEYYPIYYDRVRYVFY